MELGHVAIWGCGKDGIKLYNRIKSIFKVSCFIDLYENGKQIDGVEVVSFKEYQRISKNKKIEILIGTKKYENEIIHILKRNHYRAGEDYLTYDFYGELDMPFASIDYSTLREYMSEREALEFISVVLQHTKKKLAIMYGNCQVKSLFFCLSSNTEIMHDYILMRLPAVYEYHSNKHFSLLEEGFWEYCDLFICQKVKRDNRFDYRLSSEVIEPRIKEKTQVLVIPNMYFRGYFPQYQRNDKHNVHLEDEDEGLFPMGDKYVDTMVEEGKSKQEILDLLSAPDFLSSDDISKCCEQSFFELKGREELCDVVISDYIEKRYKEKQLFYSPNHPINEVIWEETKRILLALGYEALLFEKVEISPLIGVDIPLYPCVAKTLGIEPILDKYHPNVYLWDFKASFLEYEKKYLEICWEKNNEREDNKP